MIKVIFHTLRNCSYRKKFAHSGSKFFPLIEVPILKKGRNCKEALPDKVVSL